MINKTELITQNKFEAIHNFAIDIIIYSIHVIKWKLDGVLRKYIKTGRLINNCQNKNIQK